jgi:hypothetical protein
MYPLDILTLTQKHSKFTFVQGICGATERCRATTEHVMYWDAAHAVDLCTCSHSPVQSGLHAIALPAFADFEQQLDHCKAAAT